MFGCAAPTVYPLSNYGCTVTNTTANIHTTLYPTLYLMKPPPPIVVQIMDTGEAVVDDEDDESDALFTMDDVIDGTANIKNQSTEEVGPAF